MSQYPNSGKLNKNGFKQEGSKQPDMWGDITMDRSAVEQLLKESGDEVIIKLNAWRRESQNGEWISLAWNNFKPQTQFAPPKEAPKPPPLVEIDDKDIPFN
jgi:hypothetical protein